MGVLGWIIYLSLVAIIIATIYSVRRRGNAKDGLVTLAYLVGVPLGIILLIVFVVAVLFM